MRESALLEARALLAAETRAFASVPILPSGASLAKVEIAGPLAFRTLRKSWAELALAPALLIVTSAEQKSAFVLALAGAAAEVVDDDDLVLLLHAVAVPTAMVNASTMCEAL